MEDSQLQVFAPAAKVLAATASSKTISFCTERKYLDFINTNLSGAYTVKAVPGINVLSASWIRIKQVGKPLEDSAENCFTAIQKILFSCYLPKEIQLLFLVTGNGKENAMYLGLRKSVDATAEDINTKTYVKYLNEFVKGVWPGLQTDVIKYDDDVLAALKKDIADETLDQIYSITGIPSMDSQYKSVYPATIDMLMAGMNKSKHYAYLVVADPVNTDETEMMLYQCREMNGQIESLKSMNVQESYTQGVSYNHSISRNVSDTISRSISESVSKKSFSGLGKAAMAVTGLGMAASVLPAAGEVLSGIADVTVNITSAVLGLCGFGAVGNAITNMMPSVSKGFTEGTSHTITNGQSDSHGTSESQSQSISRNLVNKHCEAVSEHLFCHSKRFETGKAIGMWKVGVYLMASKTADITAGSLQLRSILSGQESIFEPIRIHDIGEIVDGNIKLRSLAQLTSPTLVINKPTGEPFKHPFGQTHQELKTVLTTKELSYMINFPLHSVPGISVIDSSPEFSLNAVEGTSDEFVDFGKLLYGGSITEIQYHLPLNQLAKHILLSGINGTGKTNTVQSILNSLSDKIPFLIIEPAKTEYVDWAIEYNKSHKDNPIAIYMPGCKSYRDRRDRIEAKIENLKLNPFEIVWLDKNQEPNVLSHIDRLKSTFAAAFPMYDILPVLMEDLIYTIYQNKSTDWMNQQPVYGETKAPTLNSMSISVDKVIEHRGYETKIQQNMKACLNTRIDSLKRGWKGEMLNTLKSTPWEQLFERPVVINLSYVGDDVDKGFFMSLILQFLYEYLTAKADMGKIDFNDNSCKHLTVIEEAHRVMMKCENPEMPQYKTAMMFSNMLSEIRAYGEGIMLVDQVPTRLIPDAIKNTNTKITHRLVAEDDVKAIAESMGINKEQRMIIPKLLVGQCLVSTALTTDKHWIQVNKAK